MVKEKWDSSRIANLSLHVIVVTGGSSGIGLETVRVLALKGAAVVMAVRNLEKGNACVAELKGTHPTIKIEVIELDLGSLESIRRFAEEFESKYERLDRLINNAGVMMCPHAKTTDNFEIQMGTNHLGHFALTARLLPLLRKTEGSRVVTISSATHNYSKLKLEDLNWERRKYSTQRAYSDSKLSNLLFAFELARRMKDQSPLSVAAHPGWTATDLQRHSGTIRFFGHLMAQGVAMGALPTLRAAYDEDVRPGDYFGPGGFAHMRGFPVRHASNALSRNEEKAKQLWALSENLTCVECGV